MISIFYVSSALIIMSFPITFAEKQSEYENDINSQDKEEISSDYARLQRMLERIKPEKNKKWLLHELLRHLENETHFVELLSSSGQYITHLATNLPRITFQPSEANESLIQSILNYKRKFRLTNLLEPIYLDPCSDPETWFHRKVENFSIDYIFNANTIHMKHYNCTKEIFRGAHKYLKGNGMLFFYGSFAYGTVKSPDCNANLDKLLKKCDPNWGIRDAYREMSEDAGIYNFYLDRTHFFPTPSYAELLVWKRKHDALSRNAEKYYQKYIKQK